MKQQINLNNLIFITDFKTTFASKTSQTRRTEKKKIHMKIICKNEAHKREFEFCMSGNVYELCV